MSLVFDFDNNQLPDRKARKSEDSEPVLFTNWCLFTNRCCLLTGACLLSGPGLLTGAVRTGSSQTGLRPLSFFF